jgi:cysteinyl-tRNA synthetase
MKWDSPWGEGFPGWHVECSAMSMKYLGDRFDIHTGGNDLIFPHHEDEIAQSEGATGHRVVSTWVHGGHLRLSGQKIAKSTGNVVRVLELVQRGLDPLAFRLLTFGTRYRSEMDFSWEAMEDANRRLRQLRNRMAEWAPAASSLGEEGRAFDRRFREALSDDLDMPTAVKIVNELVSTPDVPGGEKYALLASWDTVLGLDLERVAEHGFEPNQATSEKVRERDEARARKDWATSDRIRDELIAMGLEVMDTSEGTKVRPA